MLRQKKYGRLGRWDADEERRLVLAVVAHTPKPQSSRDLLMDSSASAASASLLHFHTDQDLSNKRTNLPSHGEVSGGVCNGDVKLVWKDISSYVPQR